MHDGLNYEPKATKRARYTVNQDSKMKPEEEWEPPTGQLGDGMTSLNAKYGY